LSRLTTTAPRHGTAARGPGRGWGRSRGGSGRGWIRPALAGLGIFLVTAGLLLRFYAAPRLVAAPASISQTDTLVAPRASYFDQGTLTARRGVTLTLTATIRGDPAASTSRIAVWDSFTSLADPARKTLVLTTYQRAAFNRRTGQLVSCCGAAVNDDTRIRPRGIGLAWPIGVRRATYQVFDTNTERAWPAVYAGQRRVDGVLTYRFVQHIPATVVQQMPGVPISLLGLRGPARGVVADRYFQGDVTFWVDPRTGVLIDQEERGRSVLRGPGGRGELVAADFDLRMSASSRRQLAALADKSAASIAAVQTTGPRGAIGLGLLLTLAGTIPLPRRRRATASDA
jgi:Porin PorA